MDFFELWLGISPDGGSGILEVGTALVVLTVIFLLFSRGRLPGIFNERSGNLIWPGDDRP